MTDKNGMYTPATTVARVRARRAASNTPAAREPRGEQSGTPRNDVPAKSWDRVWLGLGVLSLLVYLFHSEAVRKFGSELSRLVGKL